MSNVTWLMFKCFSVYYFRALSAPLPPHDKLGLVSLCHHPCLWIHGILGLTGILGVVEKNQRWYDQSDYSIFFWLFFIEIRSISPIHTFVNIPALIRKRSVFLNSRAGILTKVWIRDLLLFESEIWFWNYARRENIRSL